MLPPRAQLTGGARRLHRSLRSSRRPARRAAARHGARPTRWTRFSNRRGTIFATSIRTTTAHRGIAARRRLDERRPIHWRRRTRGAAPALLALLLQVLPRSGWVSGADEPFERLFHQGMVLRDGEKMSKSRGNVVGIDETAERNGVDAMRLFLLYVTPPEETSAGPMTGSAAGCACSTASGAPASRFSAPAGQARDAPAGADARRKGRCCARCTSSRNRPSTKR